MKMIDSYRNLPIGRYLEICEMARDESIDALTQQVRTISLLTDMTEDEVLALPILEYKELAGKTRFLERDYDGSMVVARSYKVGGFDLVPVRDFTKIITAQYVDYQNLSKEGEKYLVETLSTLLIPKGKKYNEGYDITEVHKAIRENLSVADVLSLSAFFLTKWLKSIRDSQTCLEREIRRMPDRRLRKTLMERMREMHFKTNGDG